MKTFLTLCATTILFGSWSGIQATVVEEGFQRNKDWVPALGRGYSLASKNMFSQCLVSTGLKQSSDPTFDYEYLFHTFASSVTRTSSASSEYERGAFVRNIRNRWYFYPKFSAMATRDASASQSINYMVSAIKVDSYYAFLKEEQTQIIPAAASIAARGDLIGFFQACGPQYIRTIRRQKEISAIFSYKTEVREYDFTSSQTYGEKVRNAVNGFSASTTTNDRSYTRNGNTHTFRLSKDSYSSSLEIDILGFGLSLNVARDEQNGGNNSLNCRSMEELDGVMNFGFKSMQDANTGVVQSVEIVPWVANIEFQATVKMDLKLEYVTCFSLQSRTCSGVQCTVDNTPTDCRQSCYPINSSTPYPCENGSICESVTCYAENSESVEVFAYSALVEDADCTDDAERAKFATSQISSFTEDIVTAPEDPCSDSPFRTEMVEFAPFLKQMNFMANAEHIIVLDSLLRESFSTIDRLGQCFSLLSAYPPEELQRYFVVNKLDPIPFQDYPATAPMTSGPSAITEADFSSPMLAERLLFLLQNDHCRPTFDANVTDCNLCARGATESINGCVVRKNRYLYGRKIQQFSNFLRYYYRPCLQALTEDDLNMASGKLYTTHWINTPQCSKMSCTVRGATWNPNTETCDLPYFFLDQGADPRVEGDPDFLVNSFCMPEFRLL